MLINDELEEMWIKNFQGPSDEKLEMSSKRVSVSIKERLAIKGGLRKKLW